MLTYAQCRLCPRGCGVDRTASQVGYCRQPGQLRAARAMLHYGEEPSIAAGGPTGAVFFSGCTLGCKFCQNHQISLEGFGREISSRQLRDIFETLIAQGARSIDLVTPTQFLPSILPALQPKLPVPVVYNCGGYESAQTLRALEGLVDIYLPDFKYADSTLARALSGAEDYPQVAAAALQEMHRQVGGPLFHGEQLVRGMIVRHLVLPGHLDNTLAVLDRLDALFPKKDILLSLMSQYVPTGNLPAPLDRSLTPEEYDGAVSWAEFLGFTNGYTQELDSATEELLPAFNLEGIL